MRTALCLEPREGRLYVFVPPLESGESYVHLLSAIEAVAKEQRLPIIIEGYQPPSDARLTKLVVTPDPGVVEVNAQPAKSWRDIVHNYGRLFDLAKESKLGTNKFMLDGRHTGTGGRQPHYVGGYDAGRKSAAPPARSAA